MKLLDERQAAYSAKLEKFKEIIKLNPMKIKKHIVSVTPKVAKMQKTSTVMGHKISAMSNIVGKSGEQVDLVNLERHVDRALVVSDLLNGLMDDTLALLG